MLKLQLALRLKMDTISSEGSGLMLDLPIIAEGGIRRGVPGVELEKMIPLKTGEVALVSCPAKSFQPASIVDCQECPFWYGFRQEKSGTHRSVCGHPMDRRIVKVKV